MTEFKILIVHWGLIPGGVARYAESIEAISQYDQIKTKSVLIHNTNWRVDNGFCNRVKPSIIQIKGRWDVAWVLKLRAIVKNEQPHCLFICGFNGGFAAYFSTLGLDIPIYASWHGDYYPSGFMQRIRAPFIEMIERVIYTYLVDNVIAVSKYAGSRLEKKGIPLHHITVIHNGIPDKIELDLNPIEKENACQSDQSHILVGTCCRLSEQKGLKWLLDAIALVKEKDPTIHFFIWGDGPQEQELKKRSYVLQIDDVLNFPGYVDHVDECLNKLDIFVMSSYAEYFSIGLLEAMRAGLAILATNVGGNPEAIRNGKEGLLTNTDAPEEFADSLLKLANSKTLRDELGGNAKRRFDAEFTEERMVRKTANWFLRSLNSDEKKGSSC